MVEAGGFTELLSQHTIKGECISYLKSNHNRSSFQQQISMFPSYFQKMQKKNRNKPKCYSVGKKFNVNTKHGFPLSLQTMFA